MKLLNLVEPILRTTDLMNSNHIITNTKLSFDPYVWAFSIILTLFFFKFQKTFGPTRTTSIFTKK